MRKKRATQGDVAEMAGVTRATVSYVLNGRAQALKITPQVIDRVEKAAKKLNYLPNLAARSLVAGQSRQIGLLIPGPEYVRSAYWGPILSGVEKAALKRDYDILLVSSRQGSLEKAKNYLVQNRIDVVICIGVAKFLEGKRFPVPPVLVGMRPEVVKVPSVYSGVGDAIRETVDTMRGNGVQQIVWVGSTEGEMEFTSSSDRVEWLTQCCKEAGLPLKIWGLGDLPRKEASLMPEAEIEYWTDRLASKRFVPKAATGFVCWNDLVALGLYQKLADSNLKPGIDVSVVGFDNYFAEAALPSLASIGFNAELMGEAAVDLALQVLERSKRGKRWHRIPTAEIPARLIRRKSLQLNC